MIRSIVAGVIVVLTALLTALPASAQTPNDKWVSLGDYLQNHYKRNGKKIKFDDTLLFVNKLAFKKSVESPKESGKITLIKPSHWSKDSVNYGYNSSKEGRVIISDLFDIEENGVKRNLSSKTENAEGWKVIEYSAPLMFDKIEGSFPGTDIAMFQNIYVALDPTLDPWPIIKAMADRKEERRENKLMEPYKEKFGSYFSTPEELGLTPLSIDKLKDGTVIENYEKFRIYKKPNGDFARTSERHGRNPDVSEYLVGAYKFTLPNGLEIKSKGFLREIIKFKNGDSLIVKKTKRHEPELFFRIKLGQFLRPDNNTFYEIDIDENKFNTEYEFKDSQRALRNPYSNFTPSYELIFSSNTIEPLKRIYKLNGNWIVNNGEGTWYYDSGYTASSPLAYWIAGERLVPCAVVNIHSVGRTLLLHNQPITDIKGRSIYYANGDSISEHNVLLNLRDSTKIEFPPLLHKARINFHNGNFYEGQVDEGDLVDAVNGTEATGREFKTYLASGILTQADGSKIEYFEGIPKEEYEAKRKAEEEKRIAEEKKQEAERLAKEKEEKAKTEAAYKKMCQKYGKANVDNAGSFNYKVGMSLKMLQEMGVVLRVGTQTGSGTWYTLFKDISSNGKMTVVDVFVNNSTGKIAIVGRPRR